VGYIERGEIRPFVAATYPLEQAREAQAAFTNKRHVGKIVLDVLQSASATDVRRS